MAGAPLHTLVESLVAALAARPEVLEAYVFGSVARGEANATSDVDLAVYVAPGFVTASPYGYAAELSALLGSVAGRDDVDLVVLNDAPPLLYHRVMAGGTRIFSRDLSTTTTREGRALSRYCDYLPQLRRIDAAFNARLVAGAFGR